MNRLNLIILHLSKLFNKGLEEEEEKRRAFEETKKY